MKCHSRKLVSMLENGPIASYIQAKETMQHYVGGTWYDDKCTQVNHAIEVVHIKVDLDQITGTIWIRNSWGPLFGINGIMEVEIESEPCYGCMRACGLYNYGLQALDFVY